MPLANALETNTLQGWNKAKDITHYLQLIKCSDIDADELEGLILKVNKL